MTTPTNTIYHRIFGRGSTEDQDVALDLSDPKIVDQYFSKTDQFAQLLLAAQNRTQLMNFESLIALLRDTNKFVVDLFLVADGGFYDYQGETNPPAWFDPHARFVAAVTKSGLSGAFKSGGAGWIIFIVGSYDFGAIDQFLQVASWNGSWFTYFGRDSLVASPDTVAWTHQGQSSDALSNVTSYLGPFNGHVNGSLVMKELHIPWPHWYSSAHTPPVQCFTPEIVTAMTNSKYLGDPNSSAFTGKLTEANFLESTIAKGIQSWTKSRFQNDFVVPGSDKPVQQVNIQRWMAQLLLTTTINIQCAQQSGDYSVPLNNFCNSELLQPSPPINGLYSNSNSNLLGNWGAPNMLVTVENYQQAIGPKGLQLAMLQEVLDDAEWDEVPLAQRVQLKYKGTLGGGEETNEFNVTRFVNVQSGEGLAPWSTLTPSYEDVVGIIYMQSLGIRLLSDKAINAILMVDFWNPIYSWRRLVLMQHLPQTTNLSSDGKTYDLETVFVANIRQSPSSKSAQSPESIFLAVYDDYDLALLQKRVSAYLNTVFNNLKQPSSVLDYMKLAESRRRIYRPLPLDEFGYTLPYALNYQDPGSLPLMEMTESGTVQQMDSDGANFLLAWTKTLATTNPQLLPVFSTNQPPPIASGPSTQSSLPLTSPVAASALPLPARSLDPCENGSLASLRQRGRCPAMSRTMGAKSATAPVKGQKLSSVNTNSAPLTNPTWSENVQALFLSPYWVGSDEATRKKIGSGWVGAMKYWGNIMYNKPLDLSNKGDVETNVLTIYRHLRSRSMPITDDPIQFWPDEALETLRTWANQGFRTNSSDPIKVSSIIPPPLDPPVTLRVRKDLRDLTDAELQLYRARIDDRLQPGLLSSKWQELCRLHGEWCLHYQEAFSLWHRGFLRYVEELIDCPIPYWNTLDPACYDPKSPVAGLPKAFLDDTYIHPESQKVRPNPLKFALALNGLSKGGGPWVTRAEILTAENPDPELFEKKVGLFRHYQEEVGNALLQTKFSYPENVTTGAGQAFGIPWQNIPFFTEHMEDSKYVYSNPVYPYQANFDGFFEQAHDNWHGWIGPDMADNAYTASDPIFLSYHANIDRILDAYLRTHPQSQYTSSFPLRPYTKMATELDYDDPREYIYTTLGDMAKNTKALGYFYGPPQAGINDVVINYLASVSKSVTSTAVSAGGRAITLLDESSGTNSSNGGTGDASAKSAELKPQILFEGVVCTQESYTIDVFAAGATSLEADAVHNNDYLGRITRIGMGTTNNPSRCRSTAVTRALIINNVELSKKVSKDGFQEVVTCLSNNETVPESEWKTWAGFTGRFIVGLDVGF